MTVHWTQCLNDWYATGWMAHLQSSNLGLIRVYALPQITLFPSRPHWTLLYLFYKIYGVWCTQNCSQPHFLAIIRQYTGALWKLSLIIPLCDEAASLYGRRNCVRKLMHNKCTFSIQLIQVFGIRETPLRQTKQNMPMIHGPKTDISNCQHFSRGDPQTIEGTAEKRGRDRKSTDRSKVGKDLSRESNSFGSPDITCMLSNTENRGTKKVLQRRLERELVWRAHGVAPSGNLFWHFKNESLNKTKWGSTIQKVRIRDPSERKSPCLTIPCRGRRDRN